MQLAEVQQLVTKIAQEYGVDPKTALLLLERETGGHPDPLNAVSEAGARGPLQVMPNTGEDLGARHGFDFNQPEGQTRAGMIYFKELMDQFGGDPALAAAAYHSGPTRVRNIINTGGDIAKELGPVGRDYYQWFKDRTGTEAAPEEVNPQSMAESIGQGLPGTASDTEWPGTPDTEWPGTPDPAPDTQIGSMEPAPLTQGQDTPSVLDLTPFVPGIGGQLPSAGAVLDLLPGIGATAGGVAGASGTLGAGTLPSAAAGGMAGEAIRQLIRRSVGAPAATGLVQKFTGQDPDSASAAATGIAAEGIGGWLGSLPIPALSALGKALPRWAQRNAAVALGYGGSSADDAFEHVPYLLKRKDVFVPGGPNKPEDLVKRLESIVKDAGQEKGRLLAGELGDVRVNPDEVRQSVQDEIRKLQIHTGPDPVTPPGAKGAVTAREKGIEMFDEAQRQAAETAGKRVAVPGKVHDRLSALSKDLGEDIGENTGEGAFQEVTFKGDPGYLTARPADEIRQRSMAAYREAKTQLDNAAGTGERRVGLNLTGQLNDLQSPIKSQWAKEEAELIAKGGTDKELAALKAKYEALLKEADELTAANTAQHHGLNALDYATEAVKRDLVGGSGGVLPAAAARTASGHPGPAAALEVTSSLLRSRGVSGRLASFFRDLQEKGAVKNPETVYALFQALTRPGQAALIQKE